MLRNIRRLLAAALLIGAVTSARAGTDEFKPGPHKIKGEELVVRDGASVGDRAVGLLDKGQLADLVSNFGLLSDFHFGTPALHWPRNGTDVQHYGFGVSLLVLANGRLVSSIYDPSSASTDFTWEAYDGSSGRFFNSHRNEENTAADGITPLLASSDRRATWPLVGGEPTWPGPFREDLEHPGQQVTGEFTSDRDIYAVLQDKRGLNLRVEQLGYSYGRPYAENFLFLRFLIHNDGDTDLNGVYAGLEADLKPDFYADDRLGAWNVAPYDNGKHPSFFFKQDLNGIAQRDDSSHFDDNWLGPVGWIGVGAVKTPGDAGITSFHYYHDDNSPVTDEGLIALMTNDPSGVENPADYFHGADSTFDDLSLQSSVDLDSLPGSEITYTISTGPFDIPAGGVQEFAIVFAIGADSTDLDKSVETSYFMANEKAFQGSGPTATPHLVATSGNGFVRLTWDNVAEASIDAITGRKDFEGYRLYKSLDGGTTWGEPVTNWYGDPIGFVPLFQCDLADSITGLDPAYGPDFPAANAWLGDDTGLKHSYLDEDVTNGLEVWYSITSYDQGVYNPDYPDSTEPSYESSRGISPFDRNTVAVVPGTVASNVQPGMLGGLSEVENRVADGTLDVSIVDPLKVNGHTYSVTFNDSGDVVDVDGQQVVATQTTLNLTDIDLATSTFTNMLNGLPIVYRNIPMTGDDMPVVDGFRLMARNIDQAGVRRMGWTRVATDTCTFDWWVENRFPGNPSSYEEVVVGLDDWRITITDTPVRIGVTAEGFSVGVVDSIDVPLKIEKSPDAASGVWEDVTQYLMLSDLRLVFDNPDIMGPFGWDLTPGGAGYNPTATGSLWPDMLLLRDDEDDSTGSMVYLKTQNGPDTATPPSVGDQYTIITYKPFTHDLTYMFTTEAPKTTGTGDLSKVKAVPNPFIVRSGLERDENEFRMMFTHLPRECTVTIYTVAGRKVRTLHHNSSSGEGFEYWDLRNEQGQDVAYGLYVYVVKVPGGKTHQGKLMVIR